MAVFKYRIALEKKEVRKLQTIISKGTSGARVITRARVLLLANENGSHKTRKEISEILMLAATTPKDICRRYVERGLDGALHDTPRPRQPRKWSGKDKAKITAIACTEPKDGYSRWTLDLLKEEVKAKLKKTVGRTTIWNVLLANEVKPWREQNVLHSVNYARV
jgi:putative transposase